MASSGDRGASPPSPSGTATRRGRARPRARGHGVFFGEQAEPRAPGRARPRPASGGCHQGRPAGRGRGRRGRSRPRPRQSPSRLTYQRSSGVGAEEEQDRVRRARPCQPQSIRPEPRFAVSPGCRSGARSSAGPCAPRGIQRTSSSGRVLDDDPRPRLPDPAVPDLAQRYDVAARPTRACISNRHLVTAYSNEHPGKVEHDQQPLIYREEVLTIRDAWRYPSRAQRPGERTCAKMGKKREDLGSR